VQVSSAHETSITGTHRLAASEPQRGIVQCLLWLERFVLVDPTASMEAVMHHALGEQKQHDCQDD